MNEYCFYIDKKQQYMILLWTVDFIAGFYIRYGVC